MYSGEKFVFLWMLVVMTTFELTNASNFLVLGDWGGVPIRPYTTDIEECTAKQMATEAKAKDSQFVVALSKKNIKLKIIEIVMKITSLS